ncbi:MAG: hypothetical protein NC347_10215 [Clostridium sp.]|nr:hypothetical protein [Clostridium sp.]
MICSKLEMCVISKLDNIDLPKCDNNRDICMESSDRRSLVKCEENGKKYIFENTEKNYVICYKMDGGIIVEDKTVPNGTSKCDYLYIIDGNEQSAILVELKGVNVSKALKQISGTLDLYKEFLRSLHVYGRVIVSSSTPNLKASPEYVNLIRKIRLNYSGNIKIIERQFIEKDIDMSKEVK